MKNRKELACYFNSLGFKFGAEIGVADGINSDTFLQEIPELFLYCIDPWTDHPDSYGKTKQRLERYNNRVVLLRKTSMEAVIGFQDESLDFVFIDGNHQFDYVMQDIIEWSKKVKKGGIVSGHDYYHFKGSGVIEAVNAYISVHRLNLRLTEVEPDSTDDKEPSFWWIKA